MSPRAYNIKVLGPALMTDDHLIAANEPLSAADRALAESFAGPQPFTESDYEEADRTTKPAKVANELRSAVALERNDDRYPMTGGGA